MTFARASYLWLKTSLYHFNFPSLYRTSAASLHHYTVRAKALCREKTQILHASHELHETIRRYFDCTLRADEPMTVNKEISLMLNGRWEDYEIWFAFLFQYTQVGIPRS